MGALHAIGDSISEAFGGENQSAIDLIMKGINAFADEIGTDGPAAIKWLKDVATTDGPIVIQWLKDVASDVKSFAQACKDAYDLIPDGFLGGIFKGIKTVSTPAVEQFFGISQLNALALAEQKAVEGAINLQENLPIKGPVVNWPNVPSSTYFGDLMPNSSTIPNSSSIPKKPIVIPPPVIPPPDPQIAKDYKAISDAMPGGKNDLDKIAALTSYIGTFKNVNTLTSAQVEYLMKDISALAAKGDAKMFGPAIQSIENTKTAMDELHQKFLDKVDFSPMSNSAVLAYGAIKIADDESWKGISTNNALMTAAKTKAASFGAKESEDSYQLQTDAVDSWAADALKKVDMTVDAQGNLAPSAQSAMDEIAKAWKAGYDQIYSTTSKAENEINALHADNVAAMQATDLTAFAAKSQQLDDAAAKAEATFKGTAKEHASYTEEMTQKTQIEMDKESQAIINAHLNYRQQDQLDVYKCQTSLDAMVAKYGEFSKEAIAARQQLHDAMNKAADDEAKQWASSLDSVSTGFATLGGSFGTMASGVTKGLSGMVSGFRAYNDQLDEDGNSTRTASQNVAILANGFMNLMSAIQNAKTASDGFFSGMESGAATGSAFGVWGAVVGAAIGGVAGYMQGASNAEKALVAQQATLDASIAQVVATYGSLQAAQALARQYGVAGQDLTTTNPQAPGGVDAGQFTADMAALAATMTLVNAGVSKYNLQVSDLADPAARLAATNTSGQALVATFNLLKTAGYNYNTIVTQMAPDLNTWLASALKAGTQIPASMQPILDQMIKAGQITEANARALLGMAADTTPAFADVSAAAARYGLTLDSLGPKVSQLKITDEATTMLADFNTLTAAGADFGAMMIDTTDATTGAVTGLHYSVQQMVDDAMKTGASIPIAMKPMLDQMAAAGLLTDNLGNALTDTSKINFTADLTTSIDDLVTALDKLVAKLSGTNDPNSVTASAQAGFGGAASASSDAADTMVADAKRTATAWALAASDSSSAWNGFAGGNGSASGSGGTSSSASPMSMSVTGPSDSASLHASSSSMQTTIYLDSAVLADKVLAKAARTLIMRGYPG
jgi:hypothetical protein